MSSSKQNAFFRRILQADTRKWFGIGFLIFLAFAVSAIMTLETDSLPTDAAEGQIAKRDIRADQNYDLVDVRSTNKLRQEAADGVQPVYDFNAGLVLSRSKKIHDSFAKARMLLKENAAGAGKTLGEDGEARLRQDVQLELGLVLTDSHYALLRQDEFSEDLEQVIITLLDPVQKRPIIEDEGKAEIQLRGEKGITLRHVMEGAPDIIENTVTDYDQILSRKEARDIYVGMAPTELQKQYHLDFIDTVEIRTALALIPEFLKSNIVFNDAETTVRRERARVAIQDISYKLKKGQIIVSRDETYQPWHITVIEGMHLVRQRTSVFVRFFGLFFLVVAAIACVYSFSYRHVRKFKPTAKDLFFLGLMLVSFLTFLRLGSFMATELKGGISFVDDITTMYYLLPMAAAPMMVRYILNSETALIFAVLLSFFAGMFLESSLGIAFYYLISGVAAAHFVGPVERRSAVFGCGIRVGLLNAVLAAGLTLVLGSGTQNPPDLELTSLNALFGLCGGLLNALVMLAISPVMESLFNYTTNIQLLELANMNHPLLREMIVRAPGTYHHSQLVGILAEAGARAIGANPLLARVGSYYHDIGKMKKPHYFVENQKGDNPHDRLSPHMSALIIESHVADGLELAREHKLPKVISAVIPEHQGTKLIGYFYNKAKKLSEATRSRVEERDFRYKGPRPQSRESGIVMLSDTVEAAVRSMPEKSPQKIQATVEKLVNSHFVDGQLDECELTLRDLHMIVGAFVKILIGIYHQRVEYPEIQNKFPMKLMKEATHDGKESTHPHSQQTPPPDNIAPLFKGQN